MRYILKDGQPVEVHAITVNDMRIVHPTDEQVDSAGAGYPLVLADVPEFDTETQVLSESWKLSSKKIRQIWTISDIPQPSDDERRLFEISSLLAASNEEFEVFKSTPLVYPVNGLRYKPSYIPDYWNSVLVLGAGAFPMNISDADCVTQQFTFAEFVAMYNWLLQQSAEEIASVNAYQGPLIAEKKELESGQN